MEKKPISLQDLRRRIYVKAKSEPTWKFWGMYVHVTKRETLREAYKVAKRNNGAPGIDGVSFKEIEEQGVDVFLEEIRTELISEQYWPTRNRIKEIPKEKGTRVLGIPTIRDRVVQGALKLILEPIFEADFKEGSYGYRPKRTAHQAVEKVSRAVIRQRTQVIDLDLKAYFDTVRHHISLEKVAKRVRDGRVLRLLKLVLKAGGKRGVPQGGPLSPLLANLYLNEVDEMLERAKAYTRQKDGYDHIDYVRFADDLVILIDGHHKWRWLVKFTLARIKQELDKLGLEINEEKTRVVDLEKGKTFSFLGFDFKRVKTRRGKWGVSYTPRMKVRTRLLQKLKKIFRRLRSQPLAKVINTINPILRGWVNYFRVGNSAKCFQYVRDWVMKKVRRHLMHARKRPGFGWNRWSNARVCTSTGLYGDYQVRYYRSESAASH